MQVKIFLACLLGLSLMFGGSVNAKHHDKTSQLKKRQLVKPTLRQKRRPVKRRKPQPQYYDHKVITYFGGTPVVTSPYLGLRSEFDGSDLLVNLPSINEDQRLLNHRLVLDNHLHAKHGKIPEYPLIELSGSLAASAMFQDRYHGSNHSNLSLDDAELDVVVHAHEWITGFTALSFDNSPNPMISHRVSNSRIFLHKGFITIGNFRNTPVYLTMGQFYAPFGRYKSHMIAGPLTSKLGRTKQRALVLGYKQQSNNHFYGNVFYFKGDASPHGANNGGVHLGYRYSGSDTQGEFSGGYIVNLADSDSLQVTGKSGFGGFSAVASSQAHRHAVPALHVQGNMSFEDIGILAEFVTALRKFDPSDLSYNSRGAKPWAFNVETALYFKMDDKTSSFALGYGRSHEALAIQIPKHRFVGSFNTAIWRDTFQSIEVRHDRNYSTGASATGNGGLAVPSTNLGKCETTITAKMALYF